MMDKFCGSRALILGGTCELALTLALYLVKNSITPILSFRNESGLISIRAALESIEGSYEAFYLNFSERDSLRSFFNQIDDNFDYLVDFAHGNYESLVASADDESIYRYFAENVSFRAEMLKIATRSMIKKRNGRLIFISSVAAVRPNPGQGFYAAAKMASESLYKSIGLELGARGITTVILRPGYINAGRGKTFLNEHGANILGKVPIKRAITKEEVAEAIIFLLSKSAEGINSTEISMDGGLTYGKQSSNL